MYIQKDIYPQILANNSKFNEQRTEVDYSENGIVKPMKPTTNLILNLHTSSLKNSPILGSDMKKATIISPYNKFKGAEALPNFKRDLRFWEIC
jgi:hypothetical protein